MAPPPPRQQTPSKGPMSHSHQQAWLQPSANQPSPTQQPQVRHPPPVQGFAAQQLAQQPPPPVCHTQNQQTSAQQPMRQQPYGQQSVVHQQFSQQVGGQRLVPTHVSQPVPVVAGYQQQVGGYASGYAQQGVAHTQHAHQSASRTSSSTTTTTTTTQTTQQQQQRQQQQSAGQLQQHQQLQIRQAPPAPQIQHHQQLQIQQAPAAPQVHHQQQQMHYVQRAQPPPPPQTVQYASPPPQVQYVAPPPPVQYIAPPSQAPVHHTTNYTTIYQAAPAQPPPQQQVVQTSSAQVVQQQRPRSPPLQLHVNITNVTSSSSLQTRPKSPPPQVRTPSPPRQLALPSPPRHSSRHDQGTNNSSTTTTTITTITRTEAESRGADFLERYDEEMARRLLVVCPPCPAGFGWEAQEDGYECEAGSHLIPYTETDAWIAGRRPHGNLIGKTFTVDEVRERYLRRAIRNGMDPRLAGELSRRSEQRSGGRRGRMLRRGHMFDDDDDDDDDLFSAFSAASRRQGMRDPFRPDSSIQDHGHRRHKPSPQLRASGPQPRRPQAARAETAHLSAQKATAGSKPPAAPSASAAPTSSPTRNKTPMTKGNVNAADLSFYARLQRSTSEHMLGMVWTFTGITEVPGLEDTSLPILTCVLGSLVDCRAVVTGAMGMTFW